MLAQQHVEDDAVDAGVLPVDQQRADHVAGLAKAVDPSFPLLVTGRVPGEVVVDDRLEVGLEVNPLGEAVGGHEDLRPLPGALDEPGDAGGPLVGGQLSRDHLDRHLRESGPQCGGHVVGGLDEAAEDDGVEAGTALLVLEQLLDLGNQQAELGVVLRA